MKNAEMKAVHFFSSGSRTHTRAPTLARTYARGVRQNGGLGCVPTYCPAHTDIHARAYVCASVDARAYVRDPGEENLFLWNSTEIDFKI